MKKIIIALTFFIFTNLYAESVKKIVIKGNERISKETIKVYGEIKINKEYSNLELNNILKNLYETDFFENVAVSLDGNTLNIEVQEYQIINTLVVEGEKANKFKEAIKKGIKLKEKNSFIKSYLNDDMNTIKLIYKSLGYNFTKVEAKYENLGDNRLNLVFIIDRGEKTKISEINFIGDKKIKNRRLRDIIVSEEDKFWKFLTKNTNLNSTNIDLDKRLLSNYYKSIGYYDVQVLSSSAEIKSTNETILTYNINAGTRYKIKKITTNIDDVFDKKIFTPLNQDFKKIVGKYYSPFSIKKLLSSLDELISENDLQFVEHSVNEIIDEDSIEIRINIFEGSKLLVERVNILGNTVTEESVIRSELLLDEGDPYNKLKLEKSIAQIKSRNLFSKVEKNIISGSSKDQRIIDISVEEKPTGELSAGAGIGTSGGSLQFAITENNWLGRGIYTSASVELSDTAFRGNLNVTDPNFNYSGNSLNYYLSNDKNDLPDSGYENTIYTTGIGTRFEQYKDIYLSPSIGFTYDDLKVLTNASSALKKQAGSFSELSFQYGIDTDKRDRKFMPTDGYSAGFNQIVPFYADAPYIKNSVFYNKYNAFSPNVIGSFKFFSSAINGLDNEDIRISKRLHLSSRKLRGFESGKVGPKDGNDYVGGNYATSANFEANLPNLLPEDINTDIGFFLDFGNVSGIDYDGSIDGAFKVRSSTGFNVNWMSPVGPVSAVLAKNLMKHNNDRTQSFNFNLGTTF